LMLIPAVKQAQSISFNVWAAWVLRLEQQQRSVNTLPTCHPHQEQSS
jgi:hypothetical protein